MSHRPTIDDVRKIARERDLPSAVLVFIMDDHRIGYVSYGKTKKLCGITRELADELYEFIQMYGNPRKKDEIITALCREISRDRAWD